MLEVRNLVAGYGDFQILHGLDLDVGAGEIVAVLGANGVGKTTLNRTLSGVVRATSGTIRFGGQDITRADHADIVRAGLIHVPEGRKVFPTLSVRDNLLLGAYARGRAERPRSLEYVLETFPRLRRRLRQTAGSMSGGEQQMLAEELFALIGRLHQSGLSILLVEQNVLQSLAVASRAYVIEHGRVALSGTAAALLEDKRLKAAYLGL